MPPFLRRKIKIWKTTNKDGGRSLRFPVVLGFRDDKTVEDINID